MSDRDADHSLDDPSMADPVVQDADVGEAVDDEKWPFGFILTIVMVSLYLAYRLIQGVVLLVDWIF